MKNDNLNNINSGSNDKREEFLLHMYDQMFNDINRHIIVVWQSVGTLIATFALFSLVEKDVISIDVACTLMILVAIWLLAHLLDAGYWYNRNLVIIANIERQFLRKADLHNIQYYFGKHRSHNKMLTHLKIQFYFGFGILMLVALYHFSTRVVPGFASPWENFELQRSLPYVFFITGAILICCLWLKRKDNYKEFTENSPGIEVDSTGIHYGDGHPSK